MSDHTHDFYGVIALTGFLLGMGLLFLVGGYFERREMLREPRHSVGKYRADIRMWYSSATAFLLATPVAPLMAPASPIYIRDDGPLATSLLVALNVIMLIGLVNMMHAYYRATHRGPILP